GRRGAGCARARVRCSRPPLSSDSLRAERLPSGSARARGWASPSARRCCSSRWARFVSSSARHSASCAGVAPLIPIASASLRARCRLPGGAHGGRAAPRTGLDRRGRRTARPVRHCVVPAGAGGGTRIRSADRGRPGHSPRRRVCAGGARDRAMTLSAITQQSVGAGIFSSAFLLSILIWLPVIVAVGIAIMPNPRGRYDTLIKQIAFFANLVTMFILFIAYNQFENFLPTMQYEEKIAWLPAIGVTYHLGVDGPGIAMLMLSGLVGIASVLASIGIRERVRTYFALLLLAQASVNGAIVARDMFVLILFWGASIVPIAL